ncbi:aldehyde dehydrogenase family protein [Isoptericola sp. S6320L]|uniref:aldehyde dehydrogenase family protein n=1 Tax=Isoptericola sp. S6320L TaxID=2926411 RepID=UPI001FF3025D|nr:aldehyde dehydrogenase family protein [Isoptericola sp. S6320L]MCK0115419.1 aldehyde dehydrogenase family protein [Isoptericola sp. S6320L]
MTTTDARPATRTLERLDPATGRPGRAVVCADADQVAAAVRTARSAFAGWRATSPAERAGLLREAATAVRAEADELGDLLCSTTGRLRGEARESAVVAADLLDEAAVAGLGRAGRVLAGAPAAMDVVRREPRGIVAVVTPWNDPYPAAAGLIAAALVTGNTVVHKPSERSDAPGVRLAGLVAQALPAGVLEVVSGDAATGEALVAHDDVALVAHVGSSAAGRRIAAAVGQRGARALLENGGKDPLVVDAGVDPARAAEQIATGAFANAGQLCTAVERVYVVEEVADAVVAELARRAEELVVGDPADPATTTGPLVDADQLAVVAAHVSGAVEAGAQVVTGGHRLDRPGSFYAPTVLDRCPDDVSLLREETFGPVAPVVRVADFDEALRRASASAYGLAATVLTPLLDHALHAADVLEVGTVKVNAVFGGAPGGSADPRRASGGGAGFGPDLLEEMTVRKAVHLEGL